MGKSRHTEQSENTKARLMTAARDLVVEKGWVAASSRAVADRAGVNQALINFHFGGKAGLFRATLERCIEAIEEEFGPWMEASSLGEYFDRGEVEAERVPEDTNFKFLFAAMLEGIHDAKIKEAVIVQLQVLRTALARFLHLRGMDDEDVGRHAVMMAAAMDGLALHYMIDPSTDGVGALRAYEEMLVTFIDRTN